MKTKLEMQAIAYVSIADVSHSISELEPHEISDLFLHVAEKMENFEDIKICTDRLLKHCSVRFGKR